VQAESMLSGSVVPFRKVSRGRRIIRHRKHGWGNHIIPLVHQRLSLVYRLGQSQSHFNAYQQLDQFQAVQNRGSRSCLPPVSLLSAAPSQNESGLW